MAHMGFTVVLVVVLGFGLFRSLRNGGSEVWGFRV